MPITETATILRPCVGGPYDGEEVAVPQKKCDVVFCLKQPERSTFHRYNRAGRRFVFGGTQVVSGDGIATFESRSGMPTRFVRVYR